MIFDIDKFIRTPRNDGTKYVDKNLCFCTWGAAAVACDEFREWLTTQAQAFSIRMFQLKCHKEHPFLESVLNACEENHMKLDNHEKATRLAIDLLMQNIPLLNSEGVYLMFHELVSDEQIHQIPAVVA